ncbi:MAG: L,D-transpeptidase [Chthoniobacterales bacterium]
MGTRWLLAFVLAAGLRAAEAQGPNGYSVEIDLQDQLAYLIEAGRVVVTTPISSGRAGYQTKRGAFKIIEKERNHYSNMYGKIVDARGNTIVSDADADMPLPRGARFVPAPMRYFMRYNGAEGMHAGYLPGYPASHGCLRLPEHNAIAFFQAVQIGTPVTVFGTTPRRGSLGEDGYTLQRRRQLRPNVYRDPRFEDRFFTPGRPMWWR